MAISLQNLRSVTPGVKPASLLPGQLCFNLVDGVMFVGDGSSTFTSFDGTTEPGPAGGGWFATPLNLEGFSEYVLANPEVYGSVPDNGQVLTYSSLQGHAIWEDPQGAINPVVYTTTNADVDAAPGVSTSAKISNALGITPVEADSAIVQGLPGDTYQGLYLFQSGDWVFAAGYADPTALQVPYSNAVSGLVATTVQAALDELSATKLDVASNTPTNGQILSWASGSPVWVSGSSLYPTAADVSYDPTGTGLPPFADTVQEALTLTWGLADSAQTDATSAQSDATSAQNTANTALTNANSALAAANDAVDTANNALTVASTALPKAGGTMTGDITFNNGQPVDAGTF